MSVLLKRTKASETQRTQTRLYLGMIFSPNQSTSNNARRTFRLGKPNRKQEDAGQQKVLPKSLISSEHDRCHLSQYLPDSTTENRSQGHSGMVQLVWGAADSLIILVSPSSVFRVVGFVDWCTLGDELFPYGNFPHTSALAGEVASWRDPHTRPQWEREGAGWSVSCVVSPRTTGDRRFGARCVTCYQHSPSSLMCPQVLYINVVVTVSYSTCSSHRYMRRQLAPL